MNDQTRELERVGEGWAGAELRGDTAFLGSFLADDFVAVGPRGFVLTKEEWLERHSSGKLRYESFRLDEVRVRLYGGTAVMIGSQTAAGKYEEHDLRGRFRATLILTKQRERWLLAGVHLSPIAGMP